MKPRRLKTLPPRKGTLTVVSREPDGRWLVVCDFTMTEWSEHAQRWIGDQKVMSRERIKQLTGIDVEAP